MNTDLNSTAPLSDDEMIEMVNVDVLPFFDSYNEDTFEFAEKYRATSIISKTDSIVKFKLQDENSSVDIDTAYFNLPGVHRQKQIISAQNQLGE